MISRTEPSPRGRRGGFWLFTLVALLALGVTVSLGRWQLSRAAEKEAQQAAVEAQNALPPLDMAAFLALDAPLDHVQRTVQLRGLWLPSQSIYLDNRQMHDVAGFYVVTPLALEGRQQTVLVQRGWVQRNFLDRASLPAVATPPGLVTVTGRIAPPPGRLLDLGHGAAPQPGAPASAPGSSVIRQNLDLEAFKAETKLPLRTDVTLLEVGPMSEGLQRDWPAPSLGIEKHYGYAFQWFGLAALVAILYVWFQFIAPWRRARRAGRL